MVWPIILKQAYFGKRMKGHSPACAPPPQQSREHSKHKPRTLSASLPSIPGWEGNDDQLNETVSKLVSYLKLSSELQGFYFHELLPTGAGQAHLDDLLPHSSLQPLGP